MAKRKYTDAQRAAHNAHVAEAKRRRNAAAAELSASVPLTSHPSEGPSEDPVRRASAEVSLGAWAAQYCAFRHRFPDSKNHPVMYEALDRAIRSSETWLAMQAPRGEAKSFKTTEALLYAVMTGRKKFVCCFTSSSSTMETLTQYIEGQFLSEDTPFAADYPGVFQALKTRGNYGQRKVTMEGRDVQIVWNSLQHGKRIFRFPQLPDCPYSGAIIVLQSISSKIRGMGFVDEKGVPLRPDMIVLDDVQDLEISRSEDRIDKIWTKLTQDILGLSGDDPLSIVVLGTPFHDQCFMSRVMKDKRFETISRPSIYHFPDRMDLWEQYRRTWEETYDEKLLELGIDSKAAAARTAYQNASEFYAAHRAEMDAGCEMSWPDRYEKKYTGVSAIENVMREYLLILREEAFNQEKQCLVSARASNDVPQLTEDAFFGKISRTLPEWVAPDWASKVTAAIDVHGNVLYYTIAAWGPGFNGHTISYGTWPKQPASAWKQAKAPNSLRRQYPGVGSSGAIRAGLEELVHLLLTHGYRREDGSEVYIEKVIIDNNNGLFRNTVTNFIKESGDREKLVGYLGEWYATGHQPRKRTEEGGMEWKYTEGSHPREVSAFRDFWKAFGLDRWLTPVGESGCMTLYKAGQMHHRRFFAEMTAKKYHPYRLSSGKTILRWDDKAEGDDHYADCDTMNFICANICGIGQKAETAVRRPRKRVKYSDIQKQKGFRD